MAIRKYTLDEAAVAEARRRFESAKVRVGRTWKCALSFDELLAAFQSDCETYEEIGKRANLTRARVGQLFSDYFAALLPHRKSGRKRRQICVLKQHHQAAREMPLDELARDITQRAKTQGLPVRQVRRKHPNTGSDRRTFYASTLIINSKRCALSDVSNRRIIGNGKRWYSAVSITKGTLEKVSVMIVRQEYEKEKFRVWILPSEVLLCKKFTGTRSRAAFHLPVERLPAYHNMRPQIDWWQYEEAWGLLR